MGREIRYVPMDYVHPRNALGQLQPMFDQTFAEACAEYDANKEAWGNRTREVTDATIFDQYTFEEWEGERPDNPAYYRPEWPEDAVMGIQAWENTTEGTPISPVYPDTEHGRDEMCRYLAANETTFADFTASAAEWKRMLFRDEFVSHSETLPNGTTITFC